MSVDESASCPQAVSTTPVMVAGVNVIVSVGTMSFFSSYF